MLEPFDLDGIVPSDSRRIERLSQGYPGKSMEAALRGYGEETAAARPRPARRAPRPKRSWTASSSSILSSNGPEVV